MKKKEKKNTYYSFSRTEKLEQEFIKKFPWIRSRGVRVQLGLDILLSLEKNVIIAALERVEED